MKKPTIKGGGKGDIAARKKPHFPRPGQSKPNVDTLFNPAILNPLDVHDTTDKDLETVATEEVSIALQAILEERRQKRDRYRLMADTEYWLCLCFQSRAQKEEFLRAVGWFEHGDKYMDGLFCAQTLGIDIEAVDLPARRGTTRIPRSLRGQEVLR